MAKFMVLFKGTASASDLMNNATPEQMQTSMNAWMMWKENLDKSIVFEWGLPLQTLSEVTPTGVQVGHSPVSGYAIMEGERDTITEVLKSHPHLQRDGASIDVLEMISMPGM